MRAHDAVSFSNITATTAAFSLTGGRYGISCMGTGFGTVTLQKLAGDGSTLLTVSSSDNGPNFTADLAAVDAAIAVLLADGATPTQAHVNTLDAAFTIFELDVAPAVSFAANGYMTVQLPPGSYKDGISRRLRFSLDGERASPSVTMIGSRSVRPRASRKER
jgi:hypothetical protein